jgi:DNA-binding MarR family transcriptional regulator
MDINTINRLKLLEEIASNTNGSQREFSKNLDISLGLVNASIKDLVKNGYCKISTTPKRRMNYILTPRGILEKSRLTYEYLLGSYRFFRDSQEKILRFFGKLEKVKTQNVLFLGAGELAEIAYSLMSQTTLKLVGIVDTARIGETFNGYIIISPNEAAKLDYDKIVYTDSPDRMRDALRNFQSNGNEMIYYLL